MKNKIKIFCLLIMVLLLCGCDSKEYEEYVNIVGDGISCVYYPYSQNYSYKDIEAIEVNATKEKVDIIYTINGEELTENYLDFSGGKLKENKTHNVGEYKLTYKDFTYINYFNFYKNEGNNCPGYIYIDPEGDRVLETLYENDYVTFSTKKSNSNGCTNNLATKCQKYTKDTYLDGKVTIELGIEKYNGELSKYFIVSNNSNEAIVHNAGNDADSYGAKIGSYTYIVRAIDWENLISDEKFVESEHLVLDEIVLMGSITINITTDTSQTLDDYADFGNVEDYYDNSNEPDTKPEEDSDSNEEDKKPDYNIEDVSVDNICTMSSYRKPMKFVGIIINFIKIIIPIIIIGFGIMDLYKAITGSKDDEIKKAIKSIVIRAVAGIFIFLLPGIIQFILNWINEWSNYENSWCCCTDCLLNPDCNVNACDSNSCKIEGMN